VNTFQKVAAAVNKVVVAAIAIPGLHKLAGGSVVVISYTGRKSGRSFRLPVSYKRTGDTVVVMVALPDKKNWWRNFLGEGGPVTLALPGGDRHGHAVTHRGDSGSVTVTVTLD
jgi:hypothetical protein